MKRSALTLALAGIAALTLAACQDSLEPTAPSPTVNRQLPSNNIGTASGGELEICLSTTSPTGVSYWLDLSNVTGLFGTEAVQASQAMTPGSCLLAIQEFGEPEIHSGVWMYAPATLAPVFSANVPGTWSYACAVDATDPPEFCPTPVTGFGNTATVKSNPYHGTSITFHFVPTEIPTPLFVIGDVEPHGIGATVNFWGSQWWKNNSMSGFVANGVASFKGYTTEADDFCGGTWVARPGNSGNPPDTIPSQVAIIVTPTVNKQGPNISGTISQILIVDVGPGYAGNPGHWGNGVVSEIACAAR